MYNSNSRTYFSCAQGNLHRPQLEASSGSIAVSEREIGDRHVLEDFGATARARDDC